MRGVTGIVVGLAFVLCCQFYLLSQAIDCSTRDDRVLRAPTEKANDVALLEARVAELLVAIQDRDNQISSLQQKLVECQAEKQKDESERIPDTKLRHFPHTMASFLHGVSRVRKDEFLDTFDYGLPEVTDMEREAGQSEVLLLYSAESAMPSSRSSSNDVDVGLAGPLLSVKDGTEKCSTLNVVSIGNPNEASDLFVGAQCLALVGHEQMYHVPRFVKTNDGNSFDLVQRETIKDRKSGEYVGHYTFVEEDNEISPARLHREFLAKYLPEVDTLKSRLKPVLESVAINNTVVIMVCNKDQSSLLHNFACACQAKGIRIDSVVVFPTDEETESLARELGFATFYDEQIFGRDADAMYKTIVLRKVVAVHLVNLLGYDLLFQDVDVVWYKDPLKLFHDPNHSLAKSDVLFADDGARWVLTLPYSANTGFFYARYNERTRHLFRSWLFALDILYANNGDQPAMKSILPEESSLTGLKVKVLSGDDFPCGNRINQLRHRDFMESVMHGKHNRTYMLHVNWNHGEQYKRGLMKQMGIWYARDASLCRRREAEARSDSFLQKCCSSEPMISCHIPDKPSLVPCEKEDWKES